MPFRTKVTKNRVNAGKPTRRVVIKKIKGTLFVSDKNDTSPPGCGRAAAVIALVIFSLFKLVF